MVPSFSSEFMLTQSQMIVECFEKTTGSSLRKRLDIEQSISGEQLAMRLYHAPAAILSHDVTMKNGLRDNIYNYANDCALQAFERTFEQQTQLPSSQSTLNISAPQDDRNNVLAECIAKGSVKFSTTRFSASGKEILLTDAILFNLFDQRGIYAGQAVVFTPQ